MSACYLCGRTGKHPLTLKDTFTSHSLCKHPQSQLMCDRCFHTIAGNYRLLWYWNEGKSKWSKVWGRSLSRLYQGDHLVYPVIEGTRTEGKDTLPIVKDLMTRKQVRGILLNPPSPPFTLVIAESGQKHILPWAQEAHSQSVFPVQFEMDTLYVDREDFTTIISSYEQLMTMGFNKAEIDSGDYRSENLLPVIRTSYAAYWSHEQVICDRRGTRLLELVSYVATKS